MKQFLSKFDDKSLHVYAGVAIAMLTGFLLYYFSHLAPGGACILGTFTGIAAGIVKELIWDGLLKKGTCSVWDAIATGFGSVLGGLTLRIIYAVLLGEGVPV